MGITLTAADEVTVDKPTSALSSSIDVVQREKKSDYSVGNWRDVQSVHFEFAAALNCRLK